jgi:hypothetical protein
MRTQGQNWRYQGVTICMACKSLLL